MEQSNSGKNSKIKKKLKKIVQFGPSSSKVIPGRRKSSTGGKSLKNKIEQKNASISEAVEEDEDEVDDFLSMEEFFRTAPPTSTKEKLSSTKSKNAKSDKAVSSIKKECVVDKLKEEDEEGGDDMFTLEEFFKAGPPSASNPSNKISKSDPILDKGKGPMEETGSKGRMTASEPILSDKSSSATSSNISTKPEGTQNDATSAETLEDDTPCSPIVTQQPSVQPVVKKYEEKIRMVKPLEGYLSMFEEGEASVYWFVVNSDGSLLAYQNETDKWQAIDPLFIHDLSGSFAIPDVPLAYVKNGPFPFLLVNDKGVISLATQDEESMVSQYLLTKLFIVFLKIFIVDMDGLLKYQRITIGSKTIKGSTKTEFGR